LHITVRETDLLNTKLLNTKLLNTKLLNTKLLNTKLLNTKLLNRLSKLLDRKLLNGGVRKLFKIRGWLQDGITGKLGAGKA